MQQPKEERLRHLIQRAFEELQKEQSYRQSIVVAKLATLGCTISTPTFSNLLTGKAVALGTISKTAKAIQQLVGEELGKQWNPDLLAFETFRTENWTPSTVGSQPKPANDPLLAGLIFHPSGRVSIRQKTDFIADARQEVIELGVRLRTFTDYFFSRSEQEYKTHIHTLLKRGVHIKVYLLDPAANEALMYFNDRGKAQKNESAALSEAPKTIAKLREVVAEFRRQQLAGSFDAYLFRHLPYCHFLSVDAALPGGKIMVSPYLYGIRRAECPVLEVDSRLQPALFRKYQDSLAATVRDAYRLDPEA